MNLNPQQQQERIVAIQKSLASGETISVLIVDDSADDAEITKDKLEEYDLDVAVTYNCEIAEQLLAHNGFSVVFMDWKLVGKSGLEALKALKEKSHAHIVILTGVATDRDAASALSHGASAVMSKPLTSEDVRLIFGLRARKL